ncbi:hypothetical protein GGS23DRAFT_276983 [Durotheca rogersii]|uniref:uncharacterized protein n=1 Tax=Durotheca rogersii TaxID=419775 RepID=UPI00221FFF1D|nr:uncharacterized protein GGS23DRAFT_276983 [Durotheca rogersii]KAI5866565.1 hypothetical protein GGS23DRAFT_276983 [Durotheca rogersii]
MRMAPASPLPHQLAMRVAMQDASATTIPFNHSGKAPQAFAAMCVRQTTPAYPQSRAGSRASVPRTLQWPRRQPAPRRRAQAQVVRAEEATRLSTHWQWVVMIVIIFVGIVGIWVGACIWRRKYLRKKDRMYELGKGLPSNVAINTQGNLVGPGARDSHYSNNPGMFMSGSAGGYYEKPKKERKRWMVGQRT